MNESRPAVLTVSLLALAALAVIAVVAAPARAAVPPNRDVSVYAGNEAEDAIAVNPTNPSNVVAMSTLPDVLAGLRVGVSFDGGSTWTRSVIGAGDALGEICCDQQLAWDHYGNLWMTYLVNTNGDILVAVSTDGGLTFAKVADIVPTRRIGDQPSISAGANSVWVSYTSEPSTVIQASGANVTGLGQFGSFRHPRTYPRPTEGAITATPPSGRTARSRSSTRIRPTARADRTSIRRSMRTAWVRRLHGSAAPGSQSGRWVRLHPGTAAPVDRRRGEPGLGPERRRPQRPAVRDLDAGVAERE